MKLFTATIALLFLALSGPAQSNDAHQAEAASTIDGVTVFLSGAQVHRKSEVLLRKGRNEISFTGLGDGILESSIQVKAPTEVLINSVSHEVDYLSANEVSEAARPIQDSLKIVAEKINTEKGLQGVLDDEKKMLLQNQSIASQEEGLDVEELVKAASFFRTRLTDILDRINKSKHAVVELQKTEARLKRQYAEVRGRQNQPFHSIKVILNTYSTRKVPVELKYLVNNASWSPMYDLRAGDNQGDVKLDYKANVSQTTGVDWENVNLTLSTGNPRLGGQAPTVSQWNLYLIEPMALQKAGRADEGLVRNYREKAEEDGYDEAEPVMEMNEETVTLADYTQVEEGATTTEFRIAVRQTVKDGQKPQQVTVQSTELPAHYRHFAVPKLDRDAFLVAEITGWESLELIPGPVHVFFEGTYISESRLNPRQTEDTLRFSLGRDPKLVVQRETLKEFCRIRFLGLNREKTFAYEFKVKNTKSVPVSLRLEDQIPISQDKSIEVKVEETSGASLEEKTGKLFWEMDLQPGESRSVRLIYSVKHPKNKVVPGI